MAKAPEKRRLEVHESAARMNAAAADRCRSDTKKWTKWGEIDDPALHPQPRRKRRRKPQQRTDGSRFSSEPIQRIQGRGGVVHYRTRFASCTVYPTHG